MILRRLTTEGSGVPRTRIKPRVWTAGALGLVLAASLLQGVPRTDIADAAVAAGITNRASIKDNGDESETGGWDAAISADGNHVAFVSRSRLADLANDDAFDNVFVRDLTTNRTVQISRGFFRPPVDDSSGPAPGSSGSGGGSATGGIARSQADDDVFTPPPDGGGTRDGAAPRPADRPANGNSNQPAISADGRYIAFVTDASNIVTKGSEPPVIVVVDRDPNGDGVYDQRRTDDTNTVEYRYIRVTPPVRDRGRPRSPRLSADAGRIVWEESGARVETALLREDGGPVSFPRAFQSLGQSRFSNQTDFVKHQRPVVSGDGGYVAFWSEEWEEITGGSFRDERLLHSRVQVWVARTGDYVRVDVDLDETYIGDDPSVRLGPPSISSDGSTIAFPATGEDNTTQLNAYVATWNPADLEDDRMISTLASRNNAGDEVNGARPQLSGDGRYITFVTDNLRTHDGVDGAAGPFSCLRQPPPALRAHSTPLPGSAPRAEAIVPDDDPRRDVRTVCQIVARDLVADGVREEAGLDRLPGVLVSAGLDRDCRPLLADEDTCAANGDSFAGAPLSGDGGRIVFGSSATDLVAGDENQAHDVFVRTFTPGLRAEPVDFGAAQTGTSVDRTATIEHVDFGPLSVEKVEVIGTNAAEFVLGSQTCSGVTLHRDERCYAEIRFTPTAAGERNAQLRVTSSRTAGPLLVDLSGTGTNVDRPPLRPPTDRPPRGKPAELSASPDPVDFGERLPLVERPDKTVTVVNDGGSPLKVDVPTIQPGSGEGTPEDFSVAKNGCTKAVKPGGKCTVGIGFTPGGSGDRSAALVLTSNSLSGPEIIDLQGEGVEQEIDVNPAVVRPSRVVEVTGTGFAPNRTVSVTIEGFPETATAKTNKRGEFTTSLLIFPKARPGERTVRAIVNGVFPEIGADKPLLVVYGTASAPDFLHRR